jgi:transposase InsO family protein
MAVAPRQPPKGCIHHTDRGSQYCSHDYQKRLKKYGFKISMGGKGNCVACPRALDPWDNAVVETFFKTLRLS